jgi:hypothetical protein
VTQPTIDENYVTASGQTIRQWAEDQVAQGNWDDVDAAIAEAIEQYQELRDCPPPTPFKDRLESMEGGMGAG